MGTSVSAAIVRTPRCSAMTMLSQIVQTIESTNVRFESLIAIILRRSTASPVEVEVWRRDRGQCAICASTKNLHFDHDIRQAIAVTDRRKSAEALQGARVLILSGQFRGVEGVCLGEESSTGRWAISPDDSDEILSLTFERDFGLLVDLSGDPRLN
jgi:hypothetical protein